MIKQIVSGGQTGADRAALDAALALGIKTGGWVPRGRWAEDGRLPDCYLNMKETASADPSARTKNNVRDSDSTVVFSRGEVFGGTKLTMETGKKLCKPILHLDLAILSMEAAAQRLFLWATTEGIEVLNVAGPRQSEDGGIHAAVRTVLVTALSSTPGNVPHPAVDHTRDNRD